MDSTILFRASTSAIARAVLAAQMALFLLNACGDAETEYAPSRHTSALLHDGGQHDAASPGFDGGLLDAAVPVASASPLEDNFSYVLLGPPDYSTEPLSTSGADFAPTSTTDDIDAGLADSGAVAATSRLRARSLLGVTPLADLPDYELEIRTCNASPAPVASDKSLLTLQVAGEANGWNLAMSRAPSSISRFAFRWPGETSLAALESLKVELQGSSSWCLSRISLRWLGVNRVSAANPQLVWEWNSEVEQSAAFTYLHGHSRTGVITLDNDPATARASFVRFTLPTSTFTVSAPANRCHGASRRGFCVKTCDTATAPTTAAIASVKHDGLWDFLALAPSEANERNEQGTVSFDNFCAIRTLQSLRISAPTADPWSVCKIYYHDYSQVALALPTDPSDPTSARRLRASTQSTNCSTSEGQGFYPLWTTDTTARTTSATTGQYTYSFNATAVDPGPSPVVARQGFLLELEPRLKACLAGTNPPDNSCNGVDDDCNGLVDDGWSASSATACVGECRTRATCTAGAVVCGAPQSEIPGNGRNDDCDLRTDESGPLGACTSDLRCDVNLACQAGFCVAPHCANDTRDVGLGELGRDCGGPDCEPCDGGSCDDACRIGDSTTPDAQATLPFSSATFTRSSGATYEPASGTLLIAPVNTLRWIGANDKRLALVEGPSRNVVRYSAELNRSPWLLPTGSTMQVEADGQTAPDSTRTADVLRSPGAPSRGPMQPQALTAGSWTLSFHALNVDPDHDYQPNARAFVVSSANVTQAAREWPIAESWRRIDAPFSVATSGPATVHISNAGSWPVPTTTPLEAPDVALWGAQLEALPFPTSYIPTTSTVSDRAGDVLTFATIPSWIRTSTWQMDVRPEFSSDELIVGTSHVLLSSSAGSVALSRAPTTGRAVLSTSFQGVRASAAITWKRGAVLRLTFDTASDLIQIHGAIEGPVSMNAPGLTFTQPLSIGRGLDGENEAYAYAAFSEPRQVAAATQTCAADPSCTCGNGSIESGEQCDTALASGCDGECESAPVVRCDADGDCANGHVCKAGAAASFNLPSQWKVCVPSVCPTANSAYCGSAGSVCGACQCTPQCADKQCGDDPSDGCGGTCEELCEPREVGCKSDSDCHPSDFCWLGQAWRFDSSAAPGANVCAPALCNDTDPRRIDCGEPSATCGQCDPAVAGQCFMGALCRKNTAPACAAGRHLNEVGVCVPDAEHDLVDAVVTAEIGALPGTFGVTSAGSAHYSVPLDLPPGRGDLKPNLELSYDSARGNGMLGVGWSLEGLSQIKVCSKSVAQDGYLDGTIALCIDGARLVPVAYDRSRDVTEWRTEFDSFTKYETSGDFFNWERGDGGIASFTAHTKDGLVLTYGRTDFASPEQDSSRQRTFTPLPIERERRLFTYAWAVGSIRDRAGNEVHIQYSSFRDDYRNDVELLPRWIGYNFINPADNDATTEILFEYRGEGESVDDECFKTPFDDLTCIGHRPDIIRGYQHGVGRLGSRLLSAVKVRVLGQHIRTYNLRYKTLDNGLSTVSSVGECAIRATGTEDCLPLVTFEHQAFASSTTRDVDLPTTSERTIVLDYDGDGRTDFAVWHDDNLLHAPAPGYVDFYLATDEGYVQAPRSTLSELNLKKGTGGTRTLPHAVTDMDGDGAQELVVFQRESLEVLSHDGSNRLLRLRAERPDGQFTRLPVLERTALADLDGDGLQDVVYCGRPHKTRPEAPEREKARVFLSQGKWLKNGIETDLSFSCSDHVVTNDSSGRESIVSWYPPAEEGDGESYRAFGQLTPGSFGIVHTVGVWNRDWGYVVGSYTLDVNGDGLRDVALVSSQNPPTYSQRVTVYLNTGANEFLLRGRLREHLYGDLAPGSSHLTFVDIDADGRDELVYRDESSRLHVRAASSDPPSWLDWADPVLFQDVVQMHVVELQGDGSPDLIVRERDAQGWQVRSGQSPIAGLVNKIKVPTHASSVPDEITISYSMGEDGVYTATPAAYDPRTRLLPRLLQPVVRDYAETSFVQNTSWSVKAQERVATFTYHSALMDRGDRGWLGFSRRDIERKGFDGIERSITTELADQRVVARGESGPFFARDPNLQGTGYDYYYYPFLGSPHTTLGSVTVSGTLPVQSGTDYVNALTRGAAVTRRYHTVRTNEELRSDKGLPFVNVAEVTESVFENEVLVDETKSEVWRDLYGNVNATRKLWTLEPGRYEVSSTAFEWESDSTRIDRWQVDLPQLATYEEAAGAGIPAVTSATSFQHGSSGLVWKIRENPDELDAETITTIRRDDWNNPEFVTVEAGQVSGARLAERVWSFAYDSFGMHVEETQNPEGHTDSFETSLADGLVRKHVDANSVTKRWQYDGFGRLMAEFRDTENISTFFNYDRASFDSNEAISVNGAFKVSARTLGGDHDNVVTYTYDTAARLVREQVLGWGPNTTVSEEYAYDSWGRLTAVSRPHLQRDPSQGVLSFMYDELGRKVREQSADARSRETYYASVATLDPVYKSPRREARWVAQVKTPKQARSTYYSDARGALIESREGDTSTQYTYGSGGFLSEVRDPVGNLTTRVSDHLGRVRELRDPDSGLHSYTYNSFGELDTYTQNSEARRHAYDRLGRLVEIQSRDGVIRHTWDRMREHSGGEVRTRYGQLMRSVTKGVAGATEEQAPGGGHIDDYYYDGPAGSLSAVKRSVLLDAELRSRETLEMRFEYDDLLRPKVVHYPGASDFAVQYEHDARGFLTKAINAFEPREEFYKVEAVDQGYRPSVIRLGGAMVETSTYNAKTGWLDSLKTTAGTRTIHDYGFGHDANGNVRYVRKHHDASESVATFYHYDTGLERLRRVTRGENGAELEGFDYSATGNILSKRRAGAATEGYTYGTGSQPDTGPQTRPHFARKVAGGAGVAVENTPDAFGRLERREGSLAPGGLQTFGYDAFGRLSRVSTGRDAPEVTEFEYNAMGERVLRRDHDGGLSTYFGALYEHRADEDDDTETFRVMVGGRAVAERIVRMDSAETRYLHRNHLGSVEAVTDAAGQVLERRGYTAFGATADVSDGESRASYTGHRAEPDIGLVDMLGRFYDARFGRFITPDPSIPSPWSGQSLNRYSYVMNNPASLIDPTGFMDDVRPDQGGGGDGVCYTNCGGYEQGTDTGHPDIAPQASCPKDSLGCSGVIHLPNRKKPSHIPSRAAQNRASPVADTDSALESPSFFGMSWESIDPHGTYRNTADSGATAVAGFIDGMLFGVGDKLRGWMGHEGVINTEDVAYKTGNYGSMAVGAGGAVKGTIALVRAAPKGLAAARAGLGVLKRLKDQRGALGKAARSALDYKETFFKAFPHLRGEVVVHHAVEQQVLKRYPGLFTEAEMHALENLRGIPKSANADLHLSQIRRAWNEFYRNNASATRQQVLDFVADLDAKLGAGFLPPR